MESGDISVFIYGTEEEAQRNADTAEIIFDDALLEYQITTTHLNHPVLEDLYIH
jgi:hypothetical protein